MLWPPIVRHSHTVHCVMASSVHWVKRRTWNCHQRQRIARQRPVNKNMNVVFIAHSMRVNAVDERQTRRPVYSIPSAPIHCYSPSTTKKRTFAMWTAALRCSAIKCSSAWSPCNIRLKRMSFNWSNAWIAPAFVLCISAKRMNCDREFSAKKWDLSPVGIATYRCWVVNTTAMRHRRKVSREISMSTTLRTLRTLKSIVPMMICRWPIRNWINYFHQ